MFNPFRNNDNERNDGEPRFIFANLHRPSHPILTNRGYKTFTSTTSFVWLLFVIVIWVFRFELTVSKDVMTSIAGSSVELAGLSLAVLGILHEFNKVDKWFKISLLLVSVLFTGVVLSGYFLTLTWKPEFDTPQSVTIVIIGILALAFILQLDWQVKFRFLQFKWVRSFKVFNKVLVSIKQIKPYILFILPLLLIWSPDLNRITSTILMFSGAILALIALMSVTTISVLSHKEQEVKDPFLETLRLRYESEIQTLIRHGELKARVLDVLETLQTESQQEMSREDKHPREPKMIDQESILSRLRRLGITDNQDFVLEALRSLVNEGQICRDNYSGPYWIVPSKQQIDTYVSNLSKLALVLTQRRSMSKKDSSFYLENYLFESLREWFAIETKVPPHIIGEYVLPKVLEKLTSQKYFFRIDEQFNSFTDEEYGSIFINRDWRIPDSKWSLWLQQAESIAKRKSKTSFSRYENEYRSAVLERLPYSYDGLLYWNANGHFAGVGNNVFWKIVSILHIPVEDKHA